MNRRYFVATMLLAHRGMPLPDGSLKYVQPGTEVAWDSAESQQLYGKLREFDPGKHQMLSHLNHTELENVIASGALAEIHAPGAPIPETPIGGDDDGTD